MASETTVNNDTIITNKLAPVTIIDNDNTPKVMACCLMAPSHYLNQCWLTITNQCQLSYVEYQEQTWMLIEPFYCWFVFIILYCVPKSKHMMMGWINIATNFPTHLWCRYHILPRQRYEPDFNSLGPSDAIWHWRSWSTLVQVMACCLMAPSHYLNQCWLIISNILWHSFEDIFIRRFEDTNQ